jgi:hypothetical protein
MDKETKLILGSLIGFQAMSKTDQDATIKTIKAFDQDPEFGLLMSKLLISFQHMTLKTQNKMIDEFRISMNKNNIDHRDSLIMFLMKDQRSAVERTCCRKILEPCLIEI